MSKTIHASKPVHFPPFCVRCLSPDFSIRKFTDSADAVFVTVSASTDIPVCNKCWRASTPWYIGFALSFVIMIAGGIPMALAQDRHEPVHPLSLATVFLGMVGVVVCALVAREKAPVKLIPNKIDGNNLRIKFFNDEYAAAFLEQNPNTSYVVNPWKFD